MDSVLAMLGGVLLTSAAMLLAARFLGPAGRGQMVVLTLIPTFAHVLLGGGLAAANVFAVARSRSVAAAATGNSILWACGVAVLLTTLAASPLGGPIADVATIGRQDLILAGATSAVVMVYQHVAGVVQGLGEFGLLKRMRVLHGGLMLISIVVAGAYESSRTPSVFFACWGLAYLLAALATVASLIPRVGRPALSAPVMRDSLRYGLRAQLAQIWDLANTRADQVVVSLIASRTVLGVYSTGVAIVELLFHVPTALGQVVFWGSAGGESRARERVPERAGLVLALSLVLGLVLTGLVWIVTPFVFGPGYDGVPGVVTILVAPVALLASGRLLAACEMGQGNPGVAGAGAAASLMVTVIADLQLVAPYGALGAAVGSGLGYVVGAGTIAVLFARKSGIDPVPGVILGFRSSVRYVRATARAAIVSRSDR